MKTTKIKYCDINFKSGLSTRIKNQEKSVDINQQREIFDIFFNIETEYKSNKSAALANKYCLKILGKLSKILNINLSLPPAITIYDKPQIIDKNLSENFCIPDTKNILINEYPYPGRSIFFKNFENLEEVNSISENLYRNKQSSSSHFLAPFIHEWLHSFHLDSIYKKFGYGGECEYMKQIYPDKKSSINGIKLLKILETKKLTNKENEVIYNTLGEYATGETNQYLEVFSEAFTKLICDSLEGIEIKHNPADLFNKYDKEYKTIINKVIQLK